MQQEAVITAGYKGKNPDSMGSQLLRNPKVAAYLAERRARIAAAADIDAERILREYARIAFADSRDVMAWGPDGVRLKPSEELTADAAATVAEVSETMGTDKGGGSIKIKLHSKAEALNALAKWARLLPESSGGINVQNAVFLGVDDAVRALAEARQRLTDGRLPEPTDPGSTATL